MERKAQAQVITTILIILLVLAVIVIVWQVVTRTVEQGTEQITTQSECMALDLTISSADVSDGEVKITRNAGGTTSDITPVILVNGAVVTATCTPLAIGQLESTACTVTLVAGDKVEVGAQIGETLCSAVAEKTAVA